MPPLRSRFLAELLGTALLLAIVVGSGIMGAKLADGNDAVALLANALATGAGLVALILTFGATSGAHFNPVVTLTACARRELSLGDAVAYLVAQFGGAAAGVVLAHLMFGRAATSTFLRPRNSTGELLAEVVATAGLLLTIRGTSRTRPDATPFAVAFYIVAAYWFTSSTSFANPAVTVARSLTSTFAGIRGADVGGFVLAQFGGAVVAAILGALLWPSASTKNPS